MSRRLVVAVALAGLLLTQAAELGAQSLTAKEIQQAQKECRVLSDELRGVDWYYYRGSPFPRIDADKDFVSLYFAVIHGQEGDRLSPLFLRFQTHPHGTWIFTQEIIVKDLDSDLPPYVIAPLPGTVHLTSNPYRSGVYEAYDYRTSLTRAQLLDREACTEAILWGHLLGKKARIQYVGQREARPLEVGPGERNGLLFVMRLYASFLEKGTMPLDAEVPIEPPVKIGFE